MSQKMWLTYTKKKTVKADPSYVAIALKCGHNKNNFICFEKKVPDQQGFDRHYNIFWKESSYNNFTLFMLNFPAQSVTIFDPPRKKFPDITKQNSI